MRFNKLTFEFLTEINTKIINYYAYNRILEKIIPKNWIIIIFLFLSILIIIKKIIYKQK